MQTGTFTVLLPSMTELIIELTEPGWKQLKFVKKSAVNESGLPLSILVNVIWNHARILGLIPI